MAIFNQLADYLLLAFGLGFVIFFHELGHFLAAKFVDVKVEQFAVGFGPAIVAWRKGIGFRIGTTTPEAEKVVQASYESQQSAQRKAASQANADDSANHFVEKLDPSTEQWTQVANTIGVGETEYRLNWVPLGGYVKMLGQDDLKPAAAQDPRAYNKKSIRARMLIVSAGVIMNVILAAIGFMVVFLRGYPIPPAVVGDVLSNSPASRAARADGTRVGLQPGDQILYFNGSKTSGDFSKVQLGVALSKAESNFPIVVQHLDGKRETLYVTPAYQGNENKGLLAIGVAPPSNLVGPDPSLKNDWNEAWFRQTARPDALDVRIGDTITQINGHDVNENESWKLSRALEESDGKLIDLTIRSESGTISHHTVTPHFQAAFDNQDLQLLGMVPRTTIEAIGNKKSPAIDRLKPDDIILSIEADSDRASNPPYRKLMDTLAAAGGKNLPVTLTVLSAGDTAPHIVANLIPSLWLGDKYGLGIALGYDEQHLVVSQTLENHPADGKIPAGSTITAVNDQPISNWFQLRRSIMEAEPGQTLTLGFTPPGAAASTATFKLTTADIDSAREISLTHDLLLGPMPGIIHTHNPLEAIGLGVVYTRDLILEFYVTLQRMFTGDISFNNMMGPVGMFRNGAQLASRGGTWLLWFLANISANLAVVNFLPIPIVDGGLFVLLILEKIQGKPLSAQTQRIVQMVGLVLILSVFLIVTYQDIARSFGYIN